MGALTAASPARRRISRDSFGSSVGSDVCSDISELENAVAQGEPSPCSGRRRRSKGSGKGERRRRRAFVHGKRIQCVRSRWKGASAAVLKGACPLTSQTYFPPPPARPPPVHPSKMQS